MKSRIGLILIAVAFGYGFISWKKSNSPAQKHIAAGVYYQQNGHRAAATQQWRQAVQLEPNNGEAWELLGDSYLTNKNYKQARDAFERLLKIDGNTPGLEERIAICALQLKDYPTAQKRAEKALKQTPQSVVALQVLSEVEKQAKQSDERVKHLQQLIDLQPQNPQFLLDMVNELGTRLEYDKAIPFADRLISVSSDLPNAYYLRGLALFKSGTNSQFLSRAEADFQKTLELDPTNIEAHRYLGRIYLQRKQPHLAIAQFEAIGKGRPYASAHFLELSNAYQQAGNPQKAKKLRMLFTRLNQFNNRLVSGKKAIELRPDNVENYLQLSLFILRSIKANESFYQLYRYRYLAKDLRSVDHYLSKATQLQPRSKQVQNAKQQLESDYSEYLNAGVKAFNQKRFQIAQNTLEKAALLRPRDERTLRAVNKLSSSP